MSVREDAVSGYCANLVATYDRLTHELALPLIDQELYAALFVQSLMDEHCPSVSSPYADTTFAAAPTFSPNASAVDHHGEALVALGATELIVAALRMHEQQTCLVLQAIALRESVVARLHSCCAAYTTDRAVADAAQFTLLRLLEEHQIVTLLTAEAVQMWRSSLSRPYPFLLKNGANYLTKVVEDCTALDATPLLRTLPHIRLANDPLCGKVNLPRMLHRLETKHRTRLVNTGAMWKVGLQPLKPIMAVAPAGSDVARAARRGTDPDTRTRHQPPLRPQRASSVATSTLSEPRTSLPRPPLSPLHGPGVDGTFDRPVPAAAGATPRSYAETSADFLAEVRRLAAALHRPDARGRTGSSMLPALGAASLSALSSHIAFSPSGATPEDARQRIPRPPPPRWRTPSQHQTQQQTLKLCRLVAATRVLKEEAALQRRQLSELHRLAEVQEVFVPLLKVPHLLPASTTVEDQAVTRGVDEVPPDSWPLDKAMWSTCAAAGRRVDRLRCMTTAREVLQTAHLLPERQRRVSNGIADLTTPSVHSHRYTRGTPTASSITTNTSSPAGSTALSPLNGALVTRAHDSSGFAMNLHSTTRTTTSTDLSSRYSDSFENASEHEARTPSPGRAEAAAATGKSSSRSSSTFSSSSSSPSSSAKASSAASSPSEPSLEQLRQQLLAEHRLTSNSVSLI